MLEALNRDGEQIRAVRTHRYNDALVVEQYALSNGLTVLYLHDPQAPIFSYQTWFRVGSGHERPGKTGMAHLFEHLMFKGTEKHPEGVFDRTLEEIGARNNAATWLDWTFYYEDVPAAHLETVIALEADRLENMRLESDQLESEREVVINERLERTDNDPDGKLSEVLWKTAYTVHPYQHPTIGWMDDIKGITLEDCLTFHKTYYAPNNAVLVVVGDVDRATLFGHLVKYYGHLESAEIPALEARAEPAQTEVRRAEVTLELSADKLLMGYHAPAITDDAYPALEVINEILSEGDSARLQRALITDGELAVGFGAFVPPFRDPGLFEISVDMRPGHTAEEGEAVVLAELARISTEGITPQELSKALNKLETRFYLQLRTAQQKANGLGFWETTAGDFTGLFTAGERYQKVTAAEVQALAQRIFRPEGRTVIIGRAPKDDPEAAREPEAAQPVEGEGQ
ncbi:MAG: M16 family metallopeptidase [Bradymonadia bacterium]